MPRLWQLVLQFLSEGTGAALLFVTDFDVDFGSREGLLQIVTLTVLLGPIFYPVIMKACALATGPRIPNHSLR